MDSLRSLPLFLPELLLTGTLCVVLVADLVFPAEKSHRVGYWVLAGLAVTTVSLLLSEANAAESLFLGSVVVDPFSRFFKFVFLAATAVTILISLRSDEFRSSRMGEYFTLLAAVAIGLFFMATSVDLIMIYLSIEVVSIVSFILAGYLKGQARSSEASLKYVIYGAFSSGIMLYGFSLLFGLTGSTRLPEIGLALAALGDSATLAFFFALILVLAGFGYKISAVPFHFWTPDVYEGSPTPITAFLSVAPKAAGFAVLIRFFNALFRGGAPLTADVGPLFADIPWQNVMAVVAAVTMTLGNLVAIQQSNIKRMLAYSSIAHAGYILVGLPVVANGGAFGMLFYIAVYLFMQLGAFLIVILVANRLGTEEIDDYKGLGFQAPFAAIAMTLFLFSLTGIPPTSGFIGKFYLFGALIASGPEWYWLAIVGVLNSVVSLYYYMRVVKVMFFDRSPSMEAFRVAGPAFGVLLAMAVPTFLLGVWWTPVGNWVERSLQFFTAAG